MRVNNKPYRTIWIKQSIPFELQIIDQRWLPHQFVTETISSVDDLSVAISDMHLRGAGCIGAAGGYGMALAVREAAKTNNFDASLKEKADRLLKTRPTAVNLSAAIERQWNKIQAVSPIQKKIDIASQTAAEIADEDAEHCQKIGENGFSMINEISKRKNGEPVNILTHCNAGWLAFVDYGTALSPIYAAQAKGIPVHVWVDETRPRNQGAQLTAWELLQQGIPHTVIADNTGGHLMQHGKVDAVFVGSDRTTVNGDVANKIGTYLKALAAHDNHIPFYAAMPSSTIDWSMEDGIKNIPIEERGSEEVKKIQGWLNGKYETVLLTPEKSNALNYGFDVTPARLVSGIITERGICPASKEGLYQLFPERQKKVRL